MARDPLTDDGILRFGSPKGATRMTGDERLVVLEVKVEEQARKSDGLSDQLTKLDEKLDRRLDALDQKITAFDQKLDQRITALDQKLDQRITGLDAKMTNQFKWLKQISESPCTE
jgi:uncharacterized coiled-coil protein SlyX